MSRNNAKTARQLRESEALEVRKTIIKATGNNAHDKEAVFEALEASNANYLARLEKLNSFRAKSKATTKKNTRQLEWETELKALQNSVETIEKELLNVMEVIVLHSMDDTEIQDVVQEMQDAEVACGAYKRTLATEYTDLKAIIRSTIESNKLSAPANANGDTDQNSNRPQPEAMCIAAEMLLSFRQGHSETGAQLSDLEEMYNQELLESRRIITTSWRDDLVGVANQQLQELLNQCLSRSSNGSSSSSSRQSVNGRDTNVNREQEEVLLVSEWCQKMKIVEKNYGLACLLVETEKQSLCLELGIKVNVGTGGDAGDGEGEDMIEQDGSVGGEDGQEGSYALGGWNKADHMIFIKAFKESKRRANASTSRSLLTDLLLSQLPHKSPESINVHEEWYRKTKLLNQKKADLTVKFNEDCKNIVDQAKEALAALQIRLQEETERDQELYQHETNRQELHRRLQELRLRRMEKDELQSKKDREQREAELLAQQELQQQARAEAAARKAEVTEYLKQKEAERAKELLAQEAKAMAERQALREQIENSRANVAHRQDLLKEKERANRQREENLRVMEAKRLEALEALAAQVPYWENIQAAESKLDHITAAVKGQEYMVPQEPGVRGHIPMYGFADKKVIKDARFRLAAALRAAGLHQTEAARTVVQSNFPRPHLAIHGIL